MIEKILPPHVQTAEHFGPDDPAISVHPLEETLIAKAVEKRRREFITTRHLAHQVLSKLGVADEPIMRGDKGNPLWPRGVCGALTHCAGYRAAVAGYSLQIRTLGIDAEPADSLPPGVFEAIALPAEQEHISILAEGVHWDRILFCAKEATYKAWYPLTGRWLGFEDAHIHVHEDGTFETEILIDGSTTDGGVPLTHFEGKWVCDKGIIITAISL